MIICTEGVRRMPDAMLIAVAVPVAMALMLFLAIRGSRQVRVRDQMRCRAGI